MILYSSPVLSVIKSGKVVFAGHGAHNILVSKPEGKRSLRKPWRRWQDNIKMHQRNNNKKLLTINVTGFIYNHKQTFLKKIYISPRSLVSEIMSLLPVNW
jgi:hypothetical protein